MPRILGRVVAALVAAQIDHMVVGSFASSFHGEPRSTRDVDLVIDPDEPGLALVVDLLRDDDTYVGDGGRAWLDRSMFNVIDTAEGWKADLILRKDRAFSRAEFDRRIPAIIDGVETWVATAEDTILAKLEWLAASQSDRQLRDVVDMIETIGSDLDRDYMERWLDELGVRDSWDAANAAALES